MWWRHCNQFYVLNMDKIRVIAYNNGATSVFKRWTHALAITRDKKTLNQRSLSANEVFQTICIQGFFTPICISVWKFVNNYRTDICYRSLFIDITVWAVDCTWYLRMLIRCIIMVLYIHWFENKNSDEACGLCVLNVR